MPLIINTNVSSLNAQRQLVRSGNELSTAMERLSSGKRINNAADDAAGLAISNRMTSQIRGLNQAVRNANDGISLIQTAEGALDESTNILHRMRELAIQAANGIYSDDDRATLDAEVQQLIQELDRIAKTTTFNGQPLLDGSMRKVELQIGSQANQTIGLDIQAMDAKTLGMGSVSVDMLGAPITSDLTNLVLNDTDISINGQSIGRFNGAEDNFQDLLDNINKNVRGVEASGYTALQSTATGDGVLENGNKLRITVEAADGSGNTIFNITDTKSMKELVEKINTVTGGILSADTDSNGRLNISNNTGATITVVAVDAANSTSSDAAAELVARATGFEIFDASAAVGAKSITDSATGQVILTSEHGDPITVALGSTGDIGQLHQLGFRESTDPGVVKGVGISAAGAQVAWNVGDLTINGTVIDNTNTDSLQGKVNAINRHSADTGVVANAYSTVSIRNIDMSAWDNAAAALFINGAEVDLGTPALPMPNPTMSDLVDAFNAKTDVTGVTASLLGDRIVLQSDQGAINIAPTGAANDIFAAAFDTTDFIHYIGTDADDDGVSDEVSVTMPAGGSVTVPAGLKLTSATGQPISIELGPNADSATLGLLEANSTAQGRFGTAIASVSIETAAKAQKAIGVIDNALETINAIRADLGAANNRLDFTINNLMSVAENTEAARSRIMDADFAAETAALSRAQVLQQASQAMLAQANAASQQVLQLLQG
jgi:Flagellin and related hook-associated proteins